MRQRVERSAPDCRAWRPARSWVPACAGMTGERLRPPAVTLPPLPSPSRALPSPSRPMPSPSRRRGPTQDPRAEWKIRISGEKKDSTMTTQSNEAETRLWLIDPVLRSKAVRYLFSTNGRRHAEFDRVTQQPSDAVRPLSEFPTHAELTARALLRAHQRQKHRLLRRAGLCLHPDPGAGVRSGAVSRLVRRWRLVEGDPTCPRPR